MQYLRIIVGENRTIKKRETILALKKDICCCVTREAIEIFHRTIGFTYYNVYTVVKVQVAQL